MLDTRLCFRTLGSAALTLMLLACSVEETPETAASEISVSGIQSSDDSTDQRTATTASTLPQGQSLDQAARFLAGYDPIGALAVASWEQHASEMSALWRELETRRLDQMRAWAETSLNLRQPEAPLIYPFGGPDFLSANRFFPQAKSLVLIGLEPPGEIWIPTASTEGTELDPRSSEDLATALERLRGGFRSLLDAGYFVTRRMEEDLAGSYLNGTLPVLMMFLAHQDYAIKDASYVEIDDAGGFRDVQPNTSSTATALRIGFIEGGSENPDARNLFYVSQDLSNEGFDSSPLARYLASLEGFNVYMKSAQYLIHGDSFASLRQALLRGALDILQDDSGIPLRYLDEATWKHAFFGVYTRTLPAYREYFQPNLAQAFAAKESTTLDFALGYNTDIGGSALIWAQRHLQVKR